VNDVKAFSAQELGKKLLGPPILGLTLPFIDKYGNPTGFSPYRNFTANDIKNGDDARIGLSTRSGYSNLGVRELAFGD